MKAVEELHISTTSKKTTSNVQGDNKQHVLCNKYFTTIFLNTVFFIEICKRNIQYSHKAGAI